MMRIVTTLDYELFLGKQTGSVKNCLLRPMEQLCSALSRAGGHFTIFVDATYLYRLRHYANSSREAASDFHAIASHLVQLRDLGHDLELHLHPQWLYSTYADGQWTMDMTHYKLKDLSREEAHRVFKSCKQLLEEIIERPVRLYRAGGFSAQPTSMLTELFEANGMLADMSVCPGCYYSTSQQEYDYRECPIDKPIYHFEEDICQETTNGKFIEIPISMYEVSPLFHWQLAFNRLMRLARHKTYGDGISIAASAESIKDRLLHTSQCIAAIDGYKSKNLTHIRDQKLQQGIDLLCLIGHPKLATPYSVDRFSQFCAYSNAMGDSFITALELLQ